VAARIRVPLSHDGDLITAAQEMLLKLSAVSDATITEQVGIDPTRSAIYVDVTATLTTDGTPVGDPGLSESDITGIESLSAHPSG